MNNNFDALQNIVRCCAESRQADERACERFLNMLYQTLRHAGGPGMPLQNVSMDIIPDPMQRLRPAPAGSFHAAWLRLGACEVLVRVRRQGGQQFEGEYGEWGRFEVIGLHHETMMALVNRMVRDIGRMYTQQTSGASTDDQPHLNLN